MWFAVEGDSVGLLLKVVKFLFTFLRVGKSNGLAANVNSLALVRECGSHARQRDERIRMNIPHLRREVNEFFAARKA
jgi:hypothetical protein